MLKKKSPKKLTHNKLGVKYNLGSDSLGNLLKAPLLMESEGLAWPLSCGHSHAIVKVGCGL